MQRSRRRHRPAPNPDSQVLPLPAQKLLPGLRRPRSDCPPSPSAPPPGRLRRPRSARLPGPGRFPRVSFSTTPLRQALGWPPWPPSAAGTRQVACQRTATGARGWQSLARRCSTRVLRRAISFLTALADAGLQPAFLRWTLMRAYAGSLERTGRALLLEEAGACLGAAPGARAAVRKLSARRAGAVPFSRWQVPGEEVVLPGFQSDCRGTCGRPRPSAAAPGPGPLGTS